MQCFRHKCSASEDWRDRRGEARVQGAGEQQLQVHSVEGDHEVLWPEQRGIGGPSGDQTVGR